MIGRILKLTLFNPIVYKSVGMDFNSMLKKCLLSPTGSECSIQYDFSFSDEGINLKYVKSGFKTPPSEEEKKTIERGDVPMRREDEDFFIPEGTYLFEQYPDIVEEAMLGTSLLQILSIKGGEGTVYVRILKENTLECVMQALRPFNGEKKNES